MHTGVRDDGLRGEFDNLIEQVLKQAIFKPLNDTIFL